ncbi:MAG: sugar kinase [Sphingobacteriaceae bacterium]|nr:MAG: sugar kinase [Sphingobacteriaceae bacterium]
MNKLYNGNVLCFGELLFRIGLDADSGWLREKQVPFFMGGAELNVATALALWSAPSQYFTALPDNHMSAQITQYVRSKNIGTQKIVYRGDRVGTYYLVTGSDMKNDSLIYDRAGSSFAGLQPGTIDWDEIFTGVSWLHFSAICPALNQNAAAICKEVVVAANKKNITISVDLNYRSKLWQYGKLPVDIMPELVSDCDMIMGNIWAAETMLGIPVDSNIHTIGTKSNYLEAGLRTSKAIANKYPKCKAIANTFRFDNNGGINYYTALYTAGKYYHTEDHTAARIINKVGSGDCFMAGLIYGFYNNHQPQNILDFATLAAFDKLFLDGDATTHTVHEIEKALIK